jgi:hypothetical protein
LPVFLFAAAKVQRKVERQKWNVESFRYLTFI